MARDDLRISAEPVGGYDGVMDRAEWISPLRRMEELHVRPLTRTVRGVALR
jgi:hypothetical protein